MPDPTPESSAIVADIEGISKTLEEQVQDLQSCLEELKQVTGIAPPPKRSGAS